MKHTVVWSQEAEKELATLWTRARDRGVISKAANEIDQRLRSHPDEEGESRSLGVRILLVPPLGVTYIVSSQDRFVRVVHVWRFETRYKG